MNNLLLAIITQEFSLAVFVRLIHDSQTIHYNCPRCYSLSLRYSIYKVQTLGFRRSLLILSHSFPFVKNFFQVFSNFFEPIRFSCLLPPRGDLSILTHRFSFVKNFFQILLNFFTVCSFSPPLADSLHILPPAYPFVKCYFPFIFDFFRPPDGGFCPLFFPLSLFCEVYLCSPA